METTLTYSEAHDMITSADFNGYGSTRLYGIIADGECAGQMTAIKSLHNLDRYNYSKIYAKTNNGVPIFKK